MQPHLLKPLPRRIITTASLGLGLCLLALPAAAQNFAVPEMARSPVQKPLPSKKTTAQKNLEAENEALKRQLEQAKKETEVAKAAKAQAAAQAAVAAPENSPNQNSSPLPPTNERKRILDLFKN